MKMNLNTNYTNLKHSIFPTLRLFTRKKRSGAHILPTESDSTCRKAGSGKTIGTGYEATLKGGGNALKTGGANP